MRGWLAYGWRLGLAAWAGLAASGATLWQLGTPDESSAEFSHWRDRTTGQRRLDYANPAQDPVFTVGRSEPGREWFAFHPGTANGVAGFRAHPFTIQFELDHRPAGAYRLYLDLLAYSARLPRLKIEVNGRTGFFYQQPELTYTAGDHAVFFQPHYAKSVIVAELPADALRQGTNALVLTAIDESGTRDDAQPSGFPWPGVSGIVYDCLRLEREPEAGAEAASVRAEPAIFFAEKEGRLSEQVEVTIRLGRWPKAVRATLRVGDWEGVEPLPVDRDFGEAKLSFLVPEFTAGTEAELRLEGGGEARSFKMRLEPARKWTLLLVPSEHLDVGYTDHASKVAELQSRSLDQALDLMERHPDFRFTVDGYWIVEQFLRGRSREQQGRLIERVREGRLEIPAVYASPFTGFASLENLVRSLYPSRRLAREHGTPFDFALITDVPSYSWSYASVLASAGLKYFVAASDAYRGPFLLYNRLHERSPLWWEGPDGGRVLTWYSRHYHQAASLFGMPPRVESARESLPRFLQPYSHEGYRSDKVILYGTQVENIALFPEQADFAERWNATQAFPRLEYSGFAEAMRRIEADQGDGHASHRGDGGPYWEDGLGANARITALARSNMRRALTAEIFSTAATTIDPSFRIDSTVWESMWENLMLIDEHSWHADVSTSDPESRQSQLQGARKNARAEDAAKAIDHLLGRALANISESIPQGSGTLVVFNSLNWPRNGWVETDLPRGQGVVDLVTGQAVPYQVLRSRPAGQLVRFLARDVPAVGYRCYAFEAVPTRELFEQESSILENQFYRVTLDPESGGVRSLIDLDSKRELIDQDHAFRFNQHLYVTGADELPNRLVQYSTVSPLPELRSHAARGGRLISVERYPFATIARLESTNLNHPRLETTVILHAHEKKLEILNRVEKRMTYDKEAAYFVFPFATAAPRFRYGIQNGFVDTATDLLPGAGQEWFTIQDWLSVEQEGAAVTWSSVDAPLVTLGDIARGTWPREFGKRPGTVFSYIMNNYTPEGYQAGQGGIFEFRYVITSGPRFNATAAARFGAEALTPLAFNEISRNDKVSHPTGRLNAQHQSLLQVASPNLSFVTWKPAENGDGTILRFVETEGQTGQARIRIPYWKLSAAWRSNSVEDNDRPLELSDGDISFDFRPFEIVTLRVR